jgi:hypothetical protein
MGTFLNDNDIYTVVFKPISTTKFQIMIAETGNISQSLRFHFEAVAY